MALPRGSSLASIIMQFWELPILDPILSLLIAGYVLFNVFKNIKEAFKIILQAVPNELSTNAIEKVLLAFDEIENVHDCHLWTMDGTFNIASIHISVNDTDFTWGKSEILKQKTRKVLYDRFHLEHITLELESFKEDCTYKDCN